MRFIRASVFFTLLLVRCVGVFNAPKASAAPVAQGAALNLPWANGIGFGVANMLAATVQSMASAATSPEDFTIEEATDPLVLSWSLAAQPHYFQYRQPRGSLGYIRIKSVAEYHFGFGAFLWTRLQWPAFEMDNTTGPAKAGVGDLNLLLLGVLHDSPPLGKFGIGPVFVFPAASHREMGRESYQVGPAFGWSNTHVKGWVFGFLGQEFFSYAGYRNRQGVNRLRLQPFIIKYLSKTWYTGTEPRITIDFENNTSTVPINLIVGRLVSRKVNISLQADAYPDWTNTPRYYWDLRMSISYLFRSPL